MTGANVCADDTLARHNRPRRAATAAARRGISFLLGAAFAGSLIFGLPASEPALAVQPAVAAAASASVPFYLVRTSANGEPEFLFAIAERYLGAGNRFTEIFELNKGRKQPGGGALTDPTVLEAGWILQLPADAKGPGVKFGPLPGRDPVQVEPGEAVPTVPATPIAAPTKDPTGGSAATPDPGAAAPDPAASGTGVLGAVLWIVVGLVLTAAALAAIHLIRRRRASVSSAAATSPATDRSASWTIDSALKILIAACAADEIAFPGLYLVTVDSTSIHVLLVAPSAKVPTGWTASTDGRTWTASLAHLQMQQVPDVTSEQFAALATLGSTDTGRLLLDLAQARGIISVDGEPEAVSGVVESWVTELTSNPWSGTKEVVRLGSRGSAQRETTDGFLSRLDRDDRGIAILDGSPTRAQAEALDALFTSPGFAWILVVKGALASASWKFRVRDGVLTSGFLPDIHHNASSADRATARPDIERQQRK